jgi:hypothetical protein
MPWMGVLLAANHFFIALIKRCLHPLSY